MVQIDSNIQGMLVDAVYGDDPPVRLSLSHAAAVAPLAASASTKAWHPGLSSPAI